MSVLKIKDGNNWVEIPASGVGVPQGGNAGEVLTKASATDYDAGWVLPLSMKLLWTNPSPTASFAAQTVSLDLSGYQMVMVIFTNQTESQSMTASFAAMGQDGRMQSFANWRQIREYTVSSTGIAFGVGKEASQTGSLADANNRAVPISIYGIKGIT